MFLERVRDMPATIRDNFGQRQPGRHFLCPYLGVLGLGSDFKHFDDLWVLCRESERHSVVIGPVDIRASL